MRGLESRVRELERSSVVDGTGLEVVILQGDDDTRKVAEAEERVGDDGLVLVIRRREEVADG